MSRPGFAKIAVPVALVPVVLGGAAACAENGAARTNTEYIVTGRSGDAIHLGACVVKYGGGSSGPYNLEVTTGVVPEGWGGNMPTAVTMYMNDEGKFNGISNVTGAVTRDDLRRALGGTPFSPNGGIYEGTLPQARGDIACGMQVPADSEVLVFSKDENGGGLVAEGTVDQLPGEIVTVQTLENGNYRLLIMHD